MGASKAADLERSRTLQSCSSFFGKTRDDPREASAAKCLSPDRSPSFVLSSNVSNADLSVLSSAKRVKRSKRVFDKERSHSKKEHVIDELSAEREQQSIDHRSSRIEQTARSASSRKGKATRK